MRVIYGESVNPREEMQKALDKMSGERLSRESKEKALQEASSVTHRFEVFQDGSWQKHLSFKYPDATTAAEDAKAGPPQSQAEFLARMSKMERERSAAVRVSREALMSKEASQAALMRKDSLRKEFLSQAGVLYPNFSAKEEKEVHALVDAQERRVEEAKKMMREQAASSPWIKNTPMRKLAVSAAAAGGTMPTGKRLQLELTHAASPLVGPSIFTRKPAEQRKHELKQFLELYQNKGTKKTYASGVAGLFRYLDEVAVSRDSFGGVDVAHYLRERIVEQGCALSTVNGDRAAIADHLRHTPRAAIMDDPLIEAVLKVAKVIAPQSKPKRHMSSELLRDIIQAHLADEPATDGAHYWTKAWRLERNITLMLLMMLGMLRESEAVNLRVADVTSKDELVRGKLVPTMQLMIVQSKTDQAKVGQLVLIARGDEAELDPWARMVKLKTLRDRARAELDVTEEDEYLFTNAEGGKLSSGTPCGIVQSAVEAANRRAEEGGEGPEKWGNPKEYGSHSLRRGGVSAARENGVSMLDIQRHGRWKSLVVFDYVGLSAEARLAVTNNLLGRDSGGEQAADEVPSAAAGRLRAAAAHSAPSAMKVTPPSPARARAPASPAVRKTGGVPASPRKKGVPASPRKRKAVSSSSDDDEEPSLEAIEEGRVEDAIFESMLEEEAATEEAGGQEAVKAKEGGKKKKKNKKANAGR